MRNILTLLFMVLSNFVFAQKNAFVLIDVSGNPRHLLRTDKEVTLNMRREAEELARQLILGQYDNARFNVNWRLSGNTDTKIQDIVNGKGKPLLESGGHLLMMPFGSRDTYQDFKINKIRRFPNDFNLYWRTPSRYVDQNTYGEIAKAKASDIAIDANLSHYYLIVISGLGEDTNSETNLYSSQEIQYLDNYRSAVIQNSLAIFRYKLPGIDFKVEIAYMDLKKMRRSQSNTTNQNNTITSQNVDKKNLEIITPKGSRKKPFQLKSDKLLISWTCLGCDENTEYTIRLSGIDKQAETQTKKIKGRYNQTVNVETDGVYKVTVSAGSGIASTQFFELETGSGAGGFLLFLLIVAILFGGGYWAYRQFFADRVTTNVELETSDDSFFNQSKTETKPDGHSDPTSGDNSGGYF